MSFELLRDQDTGVFNRRRTTAASSFGEVPEIISRAFDKSVGNGTTQGEMEQIPG